MARLTARELFKRYAAGVAFCASRDGAGNRAIGSAFHVGEGVFLTARHLVEGREIERVGFDVVRYKRGPRDWTQVGGPLDYDGGLHTTTRVDGPYLHPDPAVDAAAFRVADLTLPVLPLGGHLNDWINDDAFLLRRVLTMGYPPIPMTTVPRLVVARGEVNVVADLHAPRSPHFVISSMARGGFSGGPCLIEWDFVLGMVVSSLVRDHEAEQLGFTAVLTVEPLYDLLAHHRIMPRDVAEPFGTLWDPESPEDGAR